MSSEKKLRILVAPLDWGLGHTTRCIPIVNELLTAGVEVILAGNEVQEKILRQEFGQCEFLTLQGYNIRYSKTKGAFLQKIIRQVPQILKAIRRENKWLEKAIDQYRLDGVISDNRFGLYSSRVPSVFMTHQLLIKNPGGRRLTGLLQRLNYHRIRRFSACWVPDFPGADNLGGDMSHPASGPGIPCSYVGPLSRLQAKGGIPNQDHLLFIISGPEPQRSQFQQLIFDQLSTYKGTATVVLGLPGAPRPSAPPGIAVFDHLSPQAFNEEISRAGCIICRSGYSSVMDINAVRGLSVMVPTPGQPEQEYLGTYLMQRGFALSCAQHKFTLSAVLKQAAAFSYQGFIALQPELLSLAVADFVGGIKKQALLPAAKSNSGTSELDHKTNS